MNVCVMALKKKKKKQWTHQVAKKPFYAKKNHQGFPEMTDSRTQSNLLGHPVEPEN